MTAGYCGLSKRYPQSSTCPTSTNYCDHQEFCDGCIHCEYDEGYIVFNHYDNYKVWRRRVDVLDIPQEARPSRPQNKPDEKMIEGNRLAENQYFDASRSGDLCHLRGQFIPWAHLLIPEKTRAFRLARGSLLVAGSQTAFLYDIEKAELQQTIEVDVVRVGEVRYVDLSVHHVLIVRPLQLNVYDRATGLPVLSIPAGRRSWDFYACSENRWECIKQQGGLCFRQAARPNWDSKDDYFHAGG